MTSLTAFTVLVALVALERLAELVVSNRNARSFARGGRETGQGHYRFMVVLHSGFLVAMLVEAWVRRPEVPPTLAWTMLALVWPPRPVLVVHRRARPAGRVIIVPGLPPVTSGPYRFLSHPNYVAVVVEGIALPLVHGAWSRRWSSPWPTPRCWPSGSGSRTPRCGRCRGGSPMRDLLVAGGGPVGLATALYAARPASTSPSSSPGTA